MLYFKTRFILRFANTILLDKGTLGHRCSIDHDIVRIFDMWNRIIYTRRERNSE